MFINIIPLKSRQHGVSLVELMIGLTIGMLIVIGVLSIYTSTSVGSRNTLNSAKLNMEIRGAMDLMAEDIRRAGFGGNTFMAVGTTDLAIYDSGSCIVYSYNDDNDIDGVVSADEYFGFRIQNNTIQMRNGGSGDASNCTNGEWEDITAPDTVQIDAPTGGAHFSISYQCLRSDTNAVGANQPCVSGQAIFDAASTAATAAGSRIGLIEIREVTIDIPAHITADSTMRIALQETVAVRNHRVVIVP